MVQKERLLSIIAEIFQEKNQRDLKHSHCVHFWVQFCKEKERKEENIVVK